MDVVMGWKHRGATKLWDPRESQPVLKLKCWGFFLPPVPGFSQDIISMDLPGRLQCLESCLESWPRTTGPGNRGEGLDLDPCSEIMEFW